MSDPQTTQPSFSLDPSTGNFEQTNENKKLNEEDFQTTLFGVDVWVHPNIKTTDKDGKSIKVDSRYRNWFVAPNDQKFGRGGYIANPKNWIPKEVGNQTQGYKKSESMMESLISFGEIWYGSKFNPQTNKFERVKTQPMFNSRQKFLSAINSYPKGTKIKEDKISGYGDEKLIKWELIILAFDAIATTPATTFESRKEKGTGKGTSEEEKMRMAEKDAFFKVQDGVIQLHYDYVLSETNKDAKTTTASIGYLYQFLAVNGYSGNPLYITKGLRDQYDDDKYQMMKRLVQMLAVYEHWATTYYTPPEWWDKGWTASDDYKDANNKNLKFDSMPIDYAQAKHTLGSLAKAKKTNKHTWDERQETYGDAGQASVQGVRLAVALFAKDPVVPYYSPLPPQQKGMPFYRAVRKLAEGKTKAGDLGYGVAKNEDQVAIGLKFLETGIIHEFKTIGTERILVKNEATGKEEEVESPVRKLVPATNKITGKLDVMENHYNPSLILYRQWGLPFGRLAPANMVMRIALSGTGWRKSEGLTAQTKKIQDGKTKELSGLFVDVDGNLNIKFMTRKGFKWGNLTHTSVLPSVSSEMFDNRHTCELVLEKSNYGKFKSNDPNSDDYYEIETELSPQEKEINAPDFTVKKWTSQKGKPKEGDRILYKQEAGVAPLTLIGYPNQFFPFDRIENIGNTVQEKMTDEDGIEISNPMTGSMNWNNQNIDAFLLNPLREMFSVMKDTSVTIRTPVEIKTILTEVEKDFAQKVDTTMTQAKQKAELARYKQFAIDDLGFAVGEVVGKSQSAKLKQDRYRYKSVQTYWRNKPLHSMRHLFAQIWLKQSGWNFGLVADFGHWAILDTLKVNYGDAPNTQMAKSLQALWSKTKNLKLQEKYQSILQKKIKPDSEAVTEFKTPIEQPSDNVLKDIAGEDKADPSDVDNESDAPEPEPEATTTDILDEFASTQKDGTESIEEEPDV